MSSDGYYRRALEILADPAADYRDLVYKIAISRPSALVYIVDGTPVRREETKVRMLKKDCIKLVREGRKIEAIKLWREHTSVGLKESKEAVEALVNNLAPVKNENSPDVGSGGYLD